MTNAAVRTAEAWCRPLAGGFGQHYRVGRQVTVGDSLIILAGLAYQARLLVIGLHRRPGFKRFLLDSISHAPLHASPRFVLAVR